MRIKKAILRTPSKTVVNGLTTKNFGKPDYSLAIKQHEKYEKAFKKAGVETILLQPDENYPDSCFVEDTAILTEKFAVITNPGADSRKGETIKIEKTLNNFYDCIYKIEEPGTLDGGDILRVENSFYIGLSERTDLKGANQLKNFLEKHGFNTIFIELQTYLHLKTGVAYIGDNNIVLAGELKNNPFFNSFNKILVNDDEEYAANCIRVNDYIFLAKGFPNIKKIISELGYEVIELDMSEFMKIDGGLSCLSLRF